MRAKRELTLGGRGSERRRGDAYHEARSPSAPVAASGGGGGDGGGGGGSGGSSGAASCGMGGSIVSEEGTRGMKERSVLLLGWTLPPGRSPSALPAPPPSGQEFRETRDGEREREVDYWTELIWVESTLVFKAKSI